MNRRGFVLAILGAAAGIGLTHREAMALPVATPQPPEPELQPEAGLLTEEDRTQLAVEEARLRRYRHLTPRQRIIVRRHIVRPARRRRRRWYRQRRYYYYY